MKLIKPSFEILESKGSLKDIELAARTCYQSQDKISEDDSSAKTLVANLIKRKHFAMLEFGKNVIFEIYYNHIFDEIINLNLLHELKHFNISSTKDRLLISMNPRTAIEIYNKIDVDISGFGNLFLKAIQDEYLELISEKKINVNGPSLNVFLPISECKLTLEEYDIHKFITVKFIADRGFSHELIRMRFDTSMINEDSYAQKSTRYCDEKGDIEFIQPPWLNFDLNTNPISIFNMELSDPIDIFNMELSYIETAYKSLRQLGWKPEQARVILPNALATEIVVKASLQEWKHIFELRCDKAAHPQMRELICPLRDEFIKRGYI